MPVTVPTFEMTFTISKLRPQTIKIRINEGQDFNLHGICEIFVTFPLDVNFCDLSLSYVAILS